MVRSQNHRERLEPKRSRALDRERSQNEKTCTVTPAASHRRMTYAALTRLL